MQRFKQHLLVSRWHSGLAVCRMLLHVILSLERGEAETVLEQYTVFCAAPITDSLTPSQRDAVLEEMSVQHRLFQQVFSTKERQRWPQSIRKHLEFRAWLRWAGMWNLNNQEDGLYPIQSALNHSCAPNVVVVHPHDDSTCGLQIIAKRNIGQGEQLFHCYCAPALRARASRRDYLLRAYHFWCNCHLCQAEEAEEGGQREGAEEEEQGEEDKTCEKGEDGTTIQEGMERRNGKRKDRKSVV